MEDNRTSFLNRCHLVMKRDEVMVVELAYLLAKRFHKGQFRKEIDEQGNPVRYFEHVRRTAIHLLDLGVRDCATICTALLHDMVEDTEDQQLAVTLLNTAFVNYPEVEESVRALTKIPKEGYMERLAASMALPRGDIVLLVKMADRFDNLSTLPAHDEAFCKKQLKETKEKLLPVFTQGAANARPEFRTVHSALMLKFGGLLKDF